MDGQVNILKSMKKHTLEYTLKNILNSLAKTGSQMQQVIHMQKHMKKDLLVQLLMKEHLFLEMNLILLHLQMYIWESKNKHS